MSLRVLVCGGREYHDRKRVWDVLGKLLPLGLDILVIEGGANGADTLARQWAQFYQLEHKQFPANWTMYGKAAGSLRNKKMLVDGKPNLVVAFPGGTGTADMVSKAKKAEVKTAQIRAIQ